MRKILFLLFTLSLFSCKPSAEDIPKENPGEVLQDGDIIFQESMSAQSKAIQLATHSRYSHCGIIFKTADETYVFEAVQPVKSTLLKDWIKRGKDSHYVVKRLKNTKLLTEDVLTKMKQHAGRWYTGRDYDYYFEWSNTRYYCSELVWKIYQKKVGVTLGPLQSLKDFDLSSAAVKQKLAERYGSKIPYDEKVISPAAIFNSELLETVISN